MSASTWMSVLAQSPVPTGGWDSIFAVYGPFAPFAVFALAIIKILWDSLKESRLETKKLTDKIIDDVIPLVLETTRVIEAYEETTESIVEVGEKLDEVLPILKRLDQQAQKQVKKTRAAPIKKAATPRRKATKRT